MADCPMLEKCPFFHDRMAEMPTMANLYKTRFCKGEFPTCARHLVLTGLGREHVPADLFPNQNDRAQEILAAKKK